MAFHPNTSIKSLIPFFTTARDRLGKGSGLHIIYNLVTQSLRGTIQVQSKLAEGPEFILVLPLCIDLDLDPERELEPISYQDERRPVIRMSKIYICCTTRYAQAAISVRQT